MNSWTVGVRIGFKNWSNGLHRPIGYPRDNAWQFYHAMNTQEGKLNSPNNRLMVDRIIEKGLAVSSEDSDHPAALLARDCGLWPCLVHTKHHKKPFTTFPLLYCSRWKLAVLVKHRVRAIWNGTGKDRGVFIPSITLISKQTSTNNDGRIFPSPRSFSRSSNKFDSSLCQQSL